MVALKFAVWEKSRSKKVKNTKIESTDNKIQKNKNIKVKIWTHVTLGRLEVCSLGGQFRSQKANTLRESGWNIPFLVWEEKTANKSTQLM